MLPVLDLRELGARARRALPDRPDNAVPCTRREAGVAAVLGAPPLLMVSRSGGLLATARY